MSRNVGRPPLVLSNGHILHRWHRARNAFRRVHADGKEIRPKRHQTEDAEVPEERHLDRIFLQISEHQRHRSPAQFA